MADSNNNFNEDDDEVQVVTFQLGPPTRNANVPSSNNNNNNNNNFNDASVNDSGLMEDDLTTSFLPASAAHIAAVAARPHSSLRLVMRKIGTYVLAFTLITMLIIIPIVIYRALERRELDMAAFDSAGVMVLGTVVLSIRLVYLHFAHWYMPNVQKYVIRILFMVPLYAIQSWLSLRFRDHRIYIDTVRDLYEAFVICSFVYYLIELLGGQDALVRTFRQKARNDPDAAHHLGQHTFPLSYVLEPWELGLEFMLQCKHGVLQYVVSKTIATVFTFWFQSMGVYGEGQFRWNVAYPYLAFLLNMSVMYALYCLVKFFHAVNDDLRHPIDWHPLGKFLCVKGVVFFTWWQGIIIFYLQSHGIIHNIGAWTGEQVANGLIDYCVCIEMVGFAIAHAYTFTYTEYLPANVEQALSNHNRENNGGDASGENPSTYNPPSTLPRPMRFKDAFWSSTVPSETIQDIRRLRRGVDGVVSQQSDPGMVSLQDMKRTINEAEEEEEQQQPLTTRPQQNIV
jgi:hypothetical protein